MPDISNSTPTSLPTTRQLIRSTIIAAVIAAVLLVAVVLPAEYGVDPTGIGNVLGLTEMGRIKTSLAKEAALAESAPQNAPAVTATAPAAATETTASAAPAPAAAAPRSDVATITLQPNQGREIKLAMREGARVTFSWKTDKGVVNFDEHADSKVPPRDYHGYRKGTAVASDEGVLTAAFEGWHGWYWRNRGKEVVTVTLRTSGDYSDIKEPE
jgi:hypothetical protein